MPAFPGVQGYIDAAATSNSLDAFQKGKIDEGGTLGDLTNILANAYATAAVNRAGMLTQAQLRLGPLKAASDAAQAMYTQAVTDLP